ncbi:hypothetical protein HPP92_011201 [Vanilla planifolia]|uniref:Uncharacterized protein n=1 Tax=Vanilla planifolia TaxID=51239 RepID=A0A835RBY4_VANPL|nr:hypothetical protein HPP92_011485 [Vanilla planifolia]KAG0483117.1 hypothetical protein HPP92_011201 [Vanilla planifolia]
MASIIQALLKKVQYKMKLLAELEVIMEKELFCEAAEGAFYGGVVPGSRAAVSRRNPTVERKGIPRHCFTPSLHKLSLCSSLPLVLCFRAFAVLYDDLVIFQIGFEHLVQTVRV